MPRNGGGACTVEPEFFTRLRTDGDKAFADARVGNPNDFGGGAGNSFFIIADDIAKQRHFGQHTALGFGGVPNGAQIALIQMLKPGEYGAAFASFCVEIIFDFNDRWNRIARLTEKLQTDRARVLRHLVQYPVRRGDQAVAAFFLHTR